ncbi:phosphatidylserine decarboxylase [Alkaliphilus pronyensis]|uniref:Phosphatidylserine decarboxylase proenzyme n=1 Tax=Alkaliphilus pronyensis TaxID=1482732 RepID=A0A6I0F0M9_9FIRM|nr:phosphatidylserine decarboxylase [Alkaliphilus pronyensis]KAB3534135.1 phosphatidylserine decarboxylase [Alkaliphilus pronyensis]
MRVCFIDRETGKLKVETVAGEKYLKWLYDTNIGKSFLEYVIKKRIFSRLMGLYMDTPLSKKKIPSFINDLSINMSEALDENITSYKNFNEFFIRRLKEEARPIAMDKNKLMSTADGRVLAYDNIDINKVVQVKGIEYTLSELIGDSELANDYNGGACIITRLNPSDYHRFHFPDTGIPRKSKSIKGSLYSVNPLALSKIQKLYCKNQREVAIFQSDNFQEIIMIEVGATCVGTIVQTYEKDKPVLKGDEKGYFKFGGSTTIMFFKKAVVKIDSDLLENTLKGYETKVYMGEAIGTKLVLS